MVRKLEEIEADMKELLKKYGAKDPQFSTTGGYLLSGFFKGIKFLTTESCKAHKKAEVKDAEQYKALIDEIVDYYREYPQIDER